MLDTATAVYEAVEPIIVWKALLDGFQMGIDGQNPHVSLPSDDESGPELTS